MTAIDDELGSGPRAEPSVGSSSPEADGLIATLIGIATVLIVAVAWGGLSPVPVIHDELAYVLQCQILADGRWTAPSPPLPAFFEQMWVFVEPVVAGKYWPGHSLVMLPGCLVGLPAGVPLLLSGVTGALMYSLTTRYTSRTVAILAWALWVTSPLGLRFRATYLANVTTSVAWLVALWTVVRWWSSGRSAWLTGLHLTFGLAAITRPLTALALWAPLLAVAFGRTRQRPLTFLKSAAAGAAILLVIPIWSWYTLGTVSTTPYAEYARQYFPFDRPGFTFDNTPPRRDLPPEMARYGVALAGSFKVHTIEALPNIALVRSYALATFLFPGWRLVLLPALVLGFVVALRTRSAISLATACSVTLFLAYLAFPHPPDAIHYYLEAFPVVFVLVAIGLWAANRMLKVPRAIRTLVVGIGLSLCALDLHRTWHNERVWRRPVEAPYLLFENIPKPAIVFVKPVKDVVSAFGLVQNSSNLFDDQLWVVRDRGAENVRLLERATDRCAYVLDLKTLALEPLATSCVRP